MKCATLFYNARPEKYSFEPIIKAESRKKMKLHYFFRLLAEAFRKLVTSILMPIMVMKGKGSLKSLEKASHAPMEENLALLNKIIARNKDTEFGKAHNFAEIKNLEDFRRNVPLTTYDDYAPMIERLKAGESNILTKGKVVGYSRTSGSSGVPKYIPSTNESMQAYLKYTWSRALALGAQKLEAEGKRYKAGRGLYSSPATNECLPNGLPCSNIAEIGARKFGFIYSYLLALPYGKLFDMHNGDYMYCMYRFALEDEDVSFTFSVFFSVFLSQIVYLKKNWKLMVDDIEKGIISECVPLRAEDRAELTKLIRPNPKRAKYLRAQFEQGFDETIFKRIWPNLVVMSAIGNASFRGASTACKKLSDGIPFDYNIYGASEGLVAACYELENDQMQLLTDSCFYEFLPENGDTREVYTLDQLEVGKRYEIILTTQSGLYRYRIKDIVEVVGFRDKCPLIDFAYRRGQLINISGEKFSEDDARNTILAYEKRHNVKIDHWILYQDESTCPNRYAYLVECEDESIFGAADELEEIMGGFCKRYPGQREKFYIEKLVVQRQKKGTHEEWIQSRAAKGAFALQVKPVHSLDNDTKKDFFLSRIEQ